LKWEDHTGVAVRLGKKDGLKQGTIEKMIVSPLIFSGVVAVENVPVDFLRHCGTVFYATDKLLYYGVYLYKNYSTPLWYSFLRH
jgi:hypothetical protein